MALRSGHGRGRGKPRIEVLPADELPNPLPVANPPPAETAIERLNGRVVTSEAAKALGAKGGHAKAARRRLMAGMGIADLSEGDEFYPYFRMGEEFVEKHLAVLASTSGGSVGPGPASIVCTAGIQLATARWMSDKAATIGNFKDSLNLMASSKAQGDSSRTNLLAAYELANLEGKARQATENAPVDFFDVASPSKPEPDEGV